MDKLTEKQKRFCDYYIASGNATESAIKAGYSKSSAKQIASQNLSKVYLREYINKANSELDSDRIADMEEVKAFWTNTMREKESDLKDRLKASELIAKTNGAFIDRVEQSGSINLKVEWLDED